MSFINVIHQVVNNLSNRNILWVLYAVFLTYCSTYKVLCHFFSFYHTIFLILKQYILLYRWFNKGIPQVQAEELASLSESD